MLVHEWIDLLAQGFGPDVAWTVGFGATSSAAKLYVQAGESGELPNLPLARSEWLHIRLPLALKPRRGDIASLEWCPRKAQVVLRYYQMQSTFEDAWVIWSAGREDLRRRGEALAPNARAAQVVWRSEEYDPRNATSFVSLRPTKLGVFLASDPSSHEEAASSLFTSSAATSAPASAWIAAAQTWLN